MLGLDHTRIMLRLLKRTIRWCYRHRVIIFSSLSIVFAIVLISYLQFMSTKVDGDHTNESKFVLKTTELIEQKTQESMTENISRTSNKSLDVGDEMENEKTKLYDVHLERILNHLNVKQTVRNVDKYGSLNNDSLIIVVQVHDRIDYLNVTIGSLARARGIEDALLIFSHDYYDPKINSLVMNISFCKTLQIYFPYSLQVYTNMFPGRSANDCPEQITRDEAIAINCSNANFPDKFGHYRNPNTTQAKHHWWWKVNTVFDQLEAVRNYSGLIVFIEEDHYMVEDFIYMLKLMQRICSQSKIFSLGDHLDRIYSRKPQIFLSNWINNLGMSFNRSVWNELVQCADKFCYYDDYNWDWSLQKMAKICPGHTFGTATLQDSRVHHIGKCGMHHQTTGGCKDVSHVARLERNLKSLKLYPETVDVFSVPRFQTIGSGNGGWGDARDHELCMRVCARGQNATTFRRSDSE